MRFVDRHHIENWALRFDSKGYFPNLISRLVRSTTPKDTFVEFPDGSSTYVGGWDGRVECRESTAYVPEGISLWEFGTESTALKKAVKDTDKRTDDPLGYDPAKCTYVFVTPRFFKKKDALKQEIVEKEIWKDVIIYDSRNIEEWFDIAPAPARWFSTYTQSFPSDGIVTIEEFWNEWSTGPSVKLSPKVVTAGREFESGKLLDFLKGAPAILSIQASSKDEAVAFIIASAMQFPEEERKSFESKTLIIDTPANFRSIRINRHGLNLIAKFDDPQVLYMGVSDGHHVLVPLGADDTFNQEILKLPLVDRDELVKSLNSTGLSESQAVNYSKESALNITVLKRLLNFPQNKIEWAALEYAREIIPAMLIGRWNEEYEGDIDIINRLSGEDYESTVEKISKWLDHETPPFLKIGETWRLASPLDAWTHVADHLTSKDLKNLKNSFFAAYQHGNPVADTHGDSVASFFAQKRKYSSWAREGLVQSLILVGLYGKGLKLSSVNSPQLWVDQIISQLFEEAQGEFWISLDHELPLISEASPESFLNAIFDSLEKEPSPLLELFREREGFVTPSSHHTGLLWALEGLAWDIEYFNDSAIALSKIAGIDPGGTLANRPSNSLLEIFKPWHYQTLVDFDTRVETLRTIAKKEKSVGWNLLLGMLPTRHGVAHPTHKMRWRLFNRSFKEKYTWEEVYKTYTEVVDILISVFDYSEKQLADLLKVVHELMPHDRHKMISFLLDGIDNVKKKENTAWHALRNNLSHHRSFPDAEWALPIEDIEKLQIIYEKLTPEDTISRYSWLFDEHWPQLPEGQIDSNADDPNSDLRWHDLKEIKLNAARLHALNEILREFGLKKIISLSELVKESWILGNTLAKSSGSDEFSQELFSLLDTSNVQVLKFAQAFFFRKSTQNEDQWAINFFKEAKKDSLNESALANYFNSISPSMNIWNFIDNFSSKLSEEYWLHIDARFYSLSAKEKVFGLKKLLDHSRFISAISVITDSLEDIPSKMIVETLEKAVTTKPQENFRIDEYEINKALEELDRRTDLERERLIKLEWLYLSVLYSSGNRRSPQLLHEELASNPDFFIDILKWVYMPKNRELVDEERKGLSDEEISSRAKQAFKLLHSWKHIPGINNENVIDKSAMEQWVTRVRQLAQDFDRLDVADAQIGQVLAQYPENVSDWPPEEICQIIENINTDSLKRNFSAALYNKRGSSTRGPFDGGDIERNHAEYFGDLAKKHRRKHPNTAKIFEKLAEGYLDQAKRMDQEAERTRLEH